MLHITSKKMVEQVGKDFFTLTEYKDNIENFLSYRF